VTFITFSEAIQRQLDVAPRSRSAARRKEERPRTPLKSEREMSILLGILLYILCVAFFCGLTGFNRLDGPELRTQRLRELAGSDAPVPASSHVPASEAHG
jgi:hypothetical protein